MKQILSLYSVLLVTALCPVLSLAETVPTTTGAECSTSNQAVIESTISKVLGHPSRFIGKVICRKTPYSSDLVGLAEIDPASAPYNWKFTPAIEEGEAPLHLLAELDPSIFGGLDLADVHFSGGFSRELRKNVYLLRLPSNRLFALVTDFF